MNTATNTIVFSAPADGDINPEGALSISPDGTKLYYFSSGGLNVFNIASKSVTATIPFATGRNVVLAVTPDGTKAVVLVYSDGAEAYTIDLGTNSVTGSTSFGSDKPRSLALSPDGTTAYVLTNVSVSPATSHLYDLNVATGTATLLTSFSASASQGFAVSSDGQHIYAAISGSAVLDFNIVSSGVSAIDYPGYIHSLSISPDGSTLVADNYGSGEVAAFSLSGAGQPGVFPVGEQEPFYGYGGSAPTLRLSASVLCDSDAVRQHRRRSLSRSV